MEKTTDTALFERRVSDGQQISNEWDNLARRILGANDENWGSFIVAVA